MMFLYQFGLHWSQVNNAVANQLCVVQCARRKNDLKEMEDLLQFLLQLVAFGVIYVDFLSAVQ